MSQLTGQGQGSRPLVQGGWFLTGLLSNAPRVLESGKVSLGWRGCVKRLSLHRSPQAAFPLARMQTPQARKCSLDPWREQRSAESWGRCQTPSLLLRLERRGERLTDGKGQHPSPVAGSCSSCCRRLEAACPSCLLPLPSVPAHP